MNKKNFNDEILMTDSDEHVSVDIKIESVDQDCEVISELYPNHRVKENLVIGPVGYQKNIDEDVTRTAAPSRAQAEKLVWMMERRLHLATGHARTTSARIRLRNEWSEIARILNSEKRGCVKDWRRWAKYWKDKKSSIRRKASMVEAARQRSGGVTDEVELSHLEERILTIAGGLNFVGDKHLAINPFPDQDNSVPSPAASESMKPIVGRAQSENIIQDEDVAAECEITTSPSAPKTPEPKEVVGDPLSLLQGEDILIVPVPSDDESILPVKITEEENTPVPVVKQQVTRDTGRRILVPASTYRKRFLLQSHSQNGLPVRRRDPNLLPRTAPTARLRSRAASSSTTRQRLRRPELTTLTDRFISIEERRAETELTLARTQELYAQGYCKMADAVDRLSRTLNVVSQQIISIIQHR